VDESPASSERGRVVAALRDAQAASDDLRRELHANEQATDVLIEGLAQGVPLEQLLDAINSERMRPQLTASLQGYERKRRAARLRMIALALEQDMSVEDIQQRWAITRSLAVRNIREARGLDS
jgi:hypothetical protein